MTEDEVWENFQSQMRKSTKGVHDIQDVAINGLFVLRSVLWKKLFYLLVWNYFNEFKCLLEEIHI